MKSCCWPATSYDDVLASTIAGNLRLRDTDEALEFVGRKLPKTTYAENFLSKLNAGLVRGVTAGWANAGSEDHHRGSAERRQAHRGADRPVVRDAAADQVRV